MGKAPRKRSGSPTTGQQADSAIVTIDSADTENAASSNDNPAGNPELESATSQNSAYDSVSISNYGNRVVLMQVERNPWEGMYAFRFSSRALDNGTERAAGTSSETSSLLPRHDSNSS